MITYLGLKVSDTKPLGYVVKISVDNGWPEEIEVDWKIGKALEAAERYGRNDIRRQFHVLLEMERSR